MKINVINHRTIARRIKAGIFGIAALPVLAGLAFGSYWFVPRFINQGMYYSQSRTIEKEMSELNIGSLNHRMERAFKELPGIKEKIDDLASKDYLFERPVISESVEVLADTWHKTYAEFIDIKICSQVDQNNYLEAVAFFEQHKDDLRRGKADMEEIKTRIDSICPEKILAAAEQSQGEARLEKLVQADSLYDQMGKPDIALKERIFREYFDYVASSQNLFDETSDFSNFLEFKNKLAAFNDSSEKKASMAVKKEALESYYASAELFISKRVDTGYINERKNRINAFLEVYSEVIDLADKENREARLQAIFEKFHDSIGTLSFFNEALDSLNWADFFIEEARKYSLQESAINKYVASMYYEVARGSANQYTKDSFLEQCLFYARQCDAEACRDFSTRIAVTYCSAVTVALAEEGGVKHSRRAQLYAKAEQARNLYEQVGYDEGVKKAMELQEKLLKGE